MTRCRERLRTCSFLVARAVPILSLVLMPDGSLKNKQHDIKRLTRVDIEDQQCARPTAQVKRGRAKGRLESTPVAAKK